MACLIKQISENSIQNTAKALLSDSFVGRLLLSALFSFLLFYCLLGIEHQNLYIFGLFVATFLLTSFTLGRIFICLITSALSTILPSALIMNGSVLSVATLDVLVSTNYDEIRDFLISLPISKLFIVPILLSITILLTWTSGKSSYKIRDLILRLLSHATTTCRSHKKTALAIAAIVIAITSTYKPFTRVLNPILDELSKVSVSSLPPSTWHVIGEAQNQKNIKNYVLILGESARTDFMSLYGFPHETTPYISSIPKIYLSNFVAAGVNTTISVPLMLSLSKNSVAELENNIFSLAKEAGITTYWLSSQGYTGKYNTSQSKLANFADFRNYLSKDNDFGLVPIFEKTLKKEGIKFIVLHTLGSHVNYCNRLKGFQFPKRLGKGKNVDCYVASIAKADEFFKRIHTALKNTKEPYSLVYLSDHASNMVKDGSGFKEWRYDYLQASYRVPFIMTDSEMSDTTEIKSIRSAKNFPAFFCNWIGVTTNKKTEKFNFFSEKSDDAIVKGYKTTKRFKDLAPGITATDILK